MASTEANTDFLWLPGIPDWHLDDQGRVVAVRDAEFWTPADGGAVDCSLCYRKCHLQPGERGWCHYRVNDAGTMRLTNHGVVSCVVRQMRGYAPDPFLTYKPGALSLFVGGVNCTAGCSFCMSTDISWNPDKVPWAVGEKTLAQGLLYGLRAMAHPRMIVDYALRQHAQQIEFGINEPTLSYEYTLDIARMARAAGLDVVIETNGFCGAEVIRALAPYTNAVDVGVKGCADPAFYDRWMKSPGAVPTVLESLRAWRDAGVFVLVGDLVAPPHMQSDDEFEHAAFEFYTWVRENLGNMTPVLSTGIMFPGPQGTHKKGLMVTPPHTAEEYAQRIDAAVVMARRVGLPYAHGKRVHETIRCHNCGGVLLSFWNRSQRPENPSGIFCKNCLMPRHYCNWEGHDQFVTDGHCDHCGAAVPIVTQAGRPDIPLGYDAIPDGQRIAQHVIDTEGIPVRRA
jgi:pyruvate formate lyase activating enzyme